MKANGCQPRIKVLHNALLVHRCSDSKIWRCARSVDRAAPRGPQQIARETPSVEGDQLSSRRGSPWMTRTAIDGERLDGGPASYQGSSWLRECEVTSPRLSFSTGSARTALPARNMRSAVSAVAFATLAPLGVDEVISIKSTRAGKLPRTHLIALMTNDSRRSVARI